MGIADNIRAIRDRFDLTQRELADVAGVTENAVSKWENGYSEPRMGAIERIAACYGLRKGDIIEDGGMMRPTPTPDGFVEVPLYGSIAAGTPIEMLPVDETHPIPAIVRDRYPGAFLLRVRGESMNRVIPDGCYALIEPAQTVERDGKPYAVCVNGYDATIKRVHKLANGYELIPDSTDPTYRSQVFDYGVEGTDEITVIGRVVWYCVPFDWEI
mgnify:CR=1 FL=1